MFVVAGPKPRSKIEAEECTKYEDNSAPDRTNERRTTAQAASLGHTGNDGSVKTIALAATPKGGAQNCPSVRLTIRDR